METRGLDIHSIRLIALSNSVSEVHLAFNVTQRVKEQCNPKCKRVPLYRTSEEYIEAGGQKCVRFFFLS